MSMGIIIIILMLWLFDLQSHTGSGLREGFIDNGMEIRAFPLHNPFASRFYTPIHHTYSVIADPKHHTTLRKVIGDSHQYTVAPDKDIMQQVNQGSYDFAVIPKLLIPGQKVDNIRFVSGLYHATATFLGPNDSNLIDIGDFQHYSCPVTIGVLNGPNQICLQHLLKETGAPAQIIPFGSEDELMHGYGDKYMLYFGLTDLRHEDPVIRAITEKLPSHFLTMRKVNRGAYHITHSETAFYKAHPHYQKDMIDLIRTQQQYPLLGSVGHTELYIPSVKTQYVLICHVSVPGKKIETIMAKILRSLRTDKVFKGTTIPDMNLGQSIMEFHPAARKIFAQLSVPYGKVSSSTYSGSISP